MQSPQVNTSGRIRLSARLSENKIRFCNQTSAHDWFSSRGRYVRFAGT